MHPTNKRLFELRNLTCLVETHPDEAIAAMIELAQYYLRPGEDQDYALAYDYAAAAAGQDSPDGYLEVTRVLGNACIGTEDHELKIEYANAAITACDFDTVNRFALPDIPYNVGIICEYMGEENIMGLGYHYRDMAKHYYDRAAELAGPNALHANKMLRVKAQNAYDRVNTKNEPKLPSGIKHTRPSESYVFQ